MKNISLLMASLSLFCATSLLATEVTYTVTATVASPIQQMETELATIAKRQEECGCVAGATTSKHKKESEFCKKTSCAQLAANKVKVEGYLASLLPPGA